MAGNPEMRDFTTSLYSMGIIVPCEQAGELSCYDCMVGLETAQVFSDIRNNLKFGNIREFEGMIP